MERTHDCAVRYTAIAIMILSAALGMASIIQIFLICKPFASQWDPRVLGTCGDQVTSFIIIESAGLFLDIVILALPLKFIPRVQMRVKEKFRVILLMNIGVM